MRRRRRRRDLGLAGSCCDPQPRFRSRAGDGKGGTSGGDMDTSLRAERQRFEWRHLSLLLAEDAQAPGNGRGGAVLPAVGVGVGGWCSWVGHGALKK